MATVVEADVSRLVRRFPGSSTDKLDEFRYVCQAPTPRYSRCGGRGEGAKWEMLPQNHTTIIERLR
jgi:hypothetical protein